jgi:beta-xylosidase
MMRIKYIVLFHFFATVGVFAQVSTTWVADLGNSMYKNPILHADYSDPDVCRVGDDFYMIASSFDAVPGIPILHSKDLVNWSLIGHALKRQPPYDHFSKTQHGNGVWAPAIRYHQGEFWIYYPDPDFGIYLTKAKNILGPWSNPELVEEGKGLIDPCPLWDDDGKNYLVYAYAGSRAGIKSILAVKELNTEGSKTISEGVIVYDGHQHDPTIEGPKFHKRNGYYYIFAPAGGVATGWQTVLRSKDVYGPYERKIVMHQGASTINGPHQGAWVDTPSGEDWFIHFQDKDAYGRVVHLQPMVWKNDWPVIGEDKDGDGIGEPVLKYRKPSIKEKVAIVTPPESDEFNERLLGLQWQWQANPKATWSFLNPVVGTLRLYAITQPKEARNLWDVPNILLQKFPAEQFVATTKLSFSPHQKLEEKIGLIIMGRSYAYIGLESCSEGIRIVQGICEDTENGKDEITQEISTLGKSTIYLRVAVDKEGICSFSFSLDGRKFIAAPSTFKATKGKWIGAKMGLFCVRSGDSNDAGYADVDWFRVTDKP